MKTLLSKKYTFKNTLLKKVLQKYKKGINAQPFCILYFVFCILYFVFCILYFVFCILYFVFLQHFFLKSVYLKSVQERICDLCFQNFLCIFISHAPNQIDDVTVIIILFV